MADPKAFWSKANVAVMGAGSWGTVLAHLVSQNCESVRLWVREESRMKLINSTRTNPDYAPGLSLSERVHAFTSLERVFEGGCHALIWALPSTVTRAQSKGLAKILSGKELILHATKGVEEGTLKRVSQILLEELPCPRIGVISGPNLAGEILRGEPAATVVASQFDEVVDAGRALLTSPSFRVYHGSDVIGAEWAGTLKNVLAIAAGALDGMKLGWNARSVLLTRGLAEMIRFGMAMGAKHDTFLGLSGMGDLLATCSSPLSRNYQVGQRLAAGENLDTILKELGRTAEGVKTTQSVYEYAREREIYMPITEGVFRLLKGELTVKEMIRDLMQRPQTVDGVG